MKNWYLIPLAALVGIVAGSWGPREDLENYRESIQAERTQKKVSGTAGFDAFGKKDSSRALCRTDGGGIRGGNHQSERRNFCGSAKRIADARRAIPQNIIKTPLRFGHDFDECFRQNR